MPTSSMAPSPSTSSSANDAMNPDAITVDTSQVCAHQADGNLIYQDMVKRLQDGKSVSSVSENVRLLLSFMGPKVQTAGPRIGTGMSTAELTEMVNANGKGFFIDLGVCEDANPSRLGVYNGQIVEESPEKDLNSSFFFDRSMLSKTIPCISAANAHPDQSLVIITACKLKRNPDNSLLCDDLGNWFSYDADPEVIQLGAVPGEPRHVLSRFLVGATSAERSTEVATQVVEDLRGFLPSLEVALNPPALNLDALPWRSIYVMGLGLRKWGSIRANLRRGEESVQFLDGNRSFAGLSYDEGRCAEHIIDPLGLVSSFISLCANLGEAEPPSAWSKMTALQWASHLLHRNRHEDSFKLWQLIVACEHIVEVSGDSDKIAKLATHSRQLNDLVGICHSGVSIPEEILNNDGDGIKLAKASAEGFTIEIRNKTFNPELVEPTSPDSFDHLAASFFGADKLKRRRRTEDGIRVGKGRAVDLGACKDTYTVRRGIRRTMITVENGIVLISENTWISDFKKAVGHVAAIELSALDIGINMEFEHVKEDDLVRTDKWRFASRSVVNGIVNGELGTGAALWLLARMRSGDVKIKTESKDLSFLVGSRCSQEQNGILIFRFLDPGVTKRLPTYYAEEKLWIDVDNTGDLRRVSKKTGTILRIEEETYDGNNDELRECSVVGEYGLE